MQSIHPRFQPVYAQAMQLLGSGLTAGDRYPEVWIRDFATFIDLQCRVAQHELLREALVRFFQFQQADGAILDGLTPRGNHVDAYRFFESPAAPDWIGHKNSVETDQESSLIIAVRKYIEGTGDREFLNERVCAVTVLDRLAAAIDWVYAHRFSVANGLVWNATTIDWGDGQAIRNWEEDDKGHPLTPERLPELTELNEQSHPSLCIYTNALFSIALKDFAWIQTLAGIDSAPTLARREALNQSIRAVLWDAQHMKFIPHVYLEKGSPFPLEFDESALHFHGGTAVAMQAGLLSEDEMLHVLATMQANVAAAGARSVGLTIWPLYDVPSLNNALFYKPFNYQNGGDWPWFGARVPQALAQHGLRDKAMEVLLPMVEMIEQSGGFFEWYSPDGTPHGSASFRGTAGSIAKAIELL